MATSREDTARVEFGKAIQQREVSVNKQIDRLETELNNMMTKATQSTYIPDNMPTTEIPISEEDQLDMLSLGVAAEARLRTLTDNLKDFLVAAQA